MRFMFGLTVGVVIISLTMIYRQIGMVSVHFFIAMALGIGFAMLLMAGLMGLVFLSNGTGHDDAVEGGDKLPEDQQEDTAGRKR